MLKKILLIILAISVILGVTACKNEPAVKEGTQTRAKDESKEQVAPKKEYNIPIKSWNGFDVALTYASLNEPNAGLELRFMSTNRSGYEMSVYISRIEVNGILFQGDASAVVLDQDITIPYFKQSKALIKETGITQIGTVSGNLAIYNTVSGESCIEPFSVVVDPDVKIPEPDTSGTVVYDENDHKLIVQRLCGEGSETGFVVCGVNESSDHIEYHINSFSVGDATVTVNIYMQMPAGCMGYGILTPTLAQLGESGVSLEGVEKVTFDISVYNVSTEQISESSIVEVEF